MLPDSVAATDQGCVINMCIVFIWVMRPLQTVLLDFFSIFVVHVIEHVEEMFSILFVNIENICT